MNGEPRSVPDRWLQRNEAADTLRQRERLDAVGITVLEGPAAAVLEDGDRLAQESRYLEKPWRAAARRFVAERRKTLALLAQFDDTVLRRPVVFAGARTRAGGVLAACVAHDLDHRPAMAERWAAWQARAKETD